MATKPTDKFTFATDATYGSGPDAGNDTKANPPGYPAVTQGSVPDLGVVASFYNKLMNVLGQWTQWLDSGSSAGAPDAHIIEADAGGNVGMKALIYTRLVDSELTRVVITSADVEIRAAASPNQGANFLVSSSGASASGWTVTVNVDAADPPLDGERVWLVFNDPHATRTVDMASEGGASNPILTSTANIAQTFELIFDDTLGANGEWIPAGTVAHI
jgi:hypothetical protein